MVRNGIVSILLPLALILISVPLSASAGDDSTTFRVQDYIPERFTDFSWKLDGGVGLRLQGQDYRKNVKHLYPIPDYAYPPSASESDNSYLDFSLTNLWGFTYATRQVRFDCRWSLDAKAGSNSTSSEDSYEHGLPNFIHESDESSTRGYEIGISFAGEFRRYLLNAIHVAAVGDFHYTYEFERYDKEEHDVNFSADSAASLELTREYGRISWSNTVNRRIDFAGEIVAGWGRNYRGDHAVTAIYIIDELRRVGLLQREPTPDEMWKLAELVQELREGHGPDEREYRAGALQTITQQLVVDGLLRDLGAVELLAVEDVWDCFPVSERQFGWKLQAGFGGVDIYFNDRDDISDHWWGRYTWDYADGASQVDSQAFESTYYRYSRGERYWSPSDYWVFRAGWWHPLTSRWQIDFDAWLKLHFDHYLRERSYTVGLDDRTASAALEISYLYDARTELHVGAIYSYERYRYLYQTIFTIGGGAEYYYEKEREVYFVLSSEVSYRISVPTVLSVWCEYHRHSRIYGYTDIPSKSISHGFEFSAGVTHWLF